MPTKGPSWRENTFQQSILLLVQTHLETAGLSIKHVCGTRFTARITDSSLNCFLISSVSSNDKKRAVNFYTDFQTYNPTKLLIHYFSSSSLPIKRI